MFALIEWSLLFLLGVLILTQIIIPALLHRPCFPAFREEAKLKGDLSEALQKYDEKQAQEVVDAVKQFTKGDSK